MELGKGPGAPGTAEGAVWGSAWRKEVQGGPPGSPQFPYRLIQPGGSQSLVREKKGQGTG